MPRRAVRAVRRSGSTFGPRYGHAPAEYPPITEFPFFTFLYGDLRPSHGAARFFWSSTGHTLAAGPPRRVGLVALIVGSGAVGDEHRTSACPSVALLDCGLRRRAQSRVGVVALMARRHRLPELPAVSSLGRHGLHGGRATRIAPPLVDHLLVHGPFPAGDRDRGRASRGTPADAAPTRRLHAGARSSRTSRRSEIVVVRGDISRMNTAQLTLRRGAVRDRRGGGGVLGAGVPGGAWRPGTRPDVGLGARVSARSFRHRSLNDAPADVDVRRYGRRLHYCGHDPLQPGSGRSGGCGRRPRHPDDRRVEITDSRVGTTHSTATGCGIVVGRHLRQHGVAPAGQARRIAPSKTLRRRAGGRGDPQAVWRYTSCGRPGGRAHAATALPVTAGDRSTGRRVRSPGRPIY